MAIVPENGLVLVTGANGFLAGNIVQTLLDQGFRVRGTVRDASKHQWMLSHFGSKFSFAQVQDMTAKDAFRDAIKDVDGALHVATNVDFNPEDTNIMNEVLGFITNLLEAAQNEPSVKRVILTSSSGACSMQTAGIPYEISRETWNQFALGEAANHLMERITSCED